MCVDYEMYKPFILLSFSSQSLETMNTMENRGPVPLHVPEMLIIMQKGGLSH